MDEAIEIIREEYNRCLDLSIYPKKSGPLFNISGLEEIRKYYAYRAEGLGFALDKLERKS